MNELVDRGVLIVMVLLDLFEILGVSDCIMVMYEGWISGEFSWKEVD